MDSARSMASSLSNLINNHTEGIYRIKSKYTYDNKNVTLVELNISIVTIFLIHKF